MKQQRFTKSRCDYIVLLCAVLFVLSGCVNTVPDQKIQLYFHPVITNKPIITTTRSIALKSRDLRSTQSVAIVNRGQDAPVSIQSEQNLKETAEKALNRQFIDKGFLITNDATTHIRLDIIEAVVTAKESSTGNEISGDIQLQLVVTASDGRKLIKLYSGNTLDNATMKAMSNNMGTTFNNLFDAMLAEIAKDKVLDNFLLTHTK